MIVGALSLALAGSASAGSPRLPAGSVGTAQLQKGAVTSPKLANGAVRARNVANGTLTGKQINASTLGPVPLANDAGALGGVPPVGFQRAVSGSCAGHGAIAQINANGTVSCQPVGAGTLTRVFGAAGSGITGGGRTGSVTLGTDPTVLQRRITGACPAGEAISSVGQAGTVSCQALGSTGGTITGVSAGTGLDGGGSTGNVTLSLDPAYQLPQTCTTDESVQWTGTTWGCLTPAAVAWSLTGNAGTDPISDYVGTSDDQPLIFKTDGIQALQLEPPGDTSYNTPNVVGGYSGNSVSSGVSGATIAGGGTSVHGETNTVTGDFGTVGGGLDNQATAFGTVAGGQFNQAAANGAVTGGHLNQATGDGAVAGGYGNTASGTDATAFGGNNAASAEGATAFGGNSESGGNTASAEDASAFGQANMAGGVSATAFGHSNTAVGNQSVAAGDSNLARGSDSFALGANANASDDNSFVWSDGTQGSGPSDFGSTGTDQFDALASNGFTFQTSAPGATFTGCTFTSGDSWACTSDRNAKHDFQPISDQATLQALAELPIESWSYNLDRSGTRHVGPTAQDFMAAFHVGDNAKEISTLDEGGIALASIKGLDQLVARQRAVIARQQAEQRRQQTELAWLKAQVLKLERQRG